jgi:hypothetical protein
MQEGYEARGNTLFSIKPVRDLLRLFRKTDTPGRVKQVARDCVCIRGATLCRARLELISRDDWLKMFENASKVQHYTKPRLINCMNLSFLLQFTAVC